MELIKHLIKEGWLRTPAIIEAFYKIKREDFLPPDLKELAELNEPISIGYGQTISQPLVVAFMLELLEPRVGDKVLDVGSGSGWTTALLSEIVGKEGRVIGIELIPELKEFGEKNVSKYNFVKEKRAIFICGDGSKGFEPEAPYDRILVSATCKEVPEALKNQLKVNGKIVLPINHSILAFKKNKKGDLEGSEYPGFVFVPLRGK